MSSWPLDLARSCVPHLPRLLVLTSATQGEESCGCWKLGHFCVESCHFCVESGHFLCRRKLCRKGKREAATYLPWCINAKVVSSVEGGETGRYTTTFTLHTFTWIRAYSIHTIPSREQQQHTLNGQRGIIGRERRSFVFRLCHCKTINAAYLPPPMLSAHGTIFLFIAAEKGGVARAEGVGEKEKECTTECKSQSCSFNDCDALLFQCDIQHHSSWLAVPPEFFFLLNSFFSWILSTKHNTIQCPSRNISSQPKALRCDRNCCTSWQATIKNVSNFYNKTSY